MQRKDSKPLPCSDMIWGREQEDEERAFDGFTVMGPPSGEDARLIDRIARLEDLLMTGLGRIEDLQRENERLRHESDERLWKTLSYLSSRVDGMCEQVMRQSEEDRSQRREEKHRQAEERWEKRNEPINDLVARMIALEQRLEGATVTFEKSEGTAFEDAQRFQNAIIRSGLAHRFMPPPPSNDAGGLGQLVPFLARNASSALAPGVFGVGRAVSGRTNPEQ